MVSAKMGDVGSGTTTRSVGVYRRDGLTWAVFGALSAFGFLNAVLGPALPFIRAEEQISYLVGALHLVAFALGGGLAGLLAARSSRSGRTVFVRVGLLGAALAGVAVGYADAVVVTVSAACLMSLLGTSATIRLWAALADEHRAWRSVAMAEGEVAVSLGGIVAPLLVGGLAATSLGWRTALLLGGALVGAAVVGSCGVVIPSAAAPQATELQGATRTDPPRRRPPATLVIVCAIVALEFALSFWLASYLNDDVGLGRELAATMVAALYAANLVGRLLASRLARWITAQRLLAASLVLSLSGLPVLLAADNLAAAIAGVGVTGAGIGALFPLTSSLHVAASPRAADSAVGQILAAAAVGQITGPLAAGVIAQLTSLRIGLLVLPALVLLALGGLTLHRPPPTTSPERSDSARPRR
jgi:MFS family permease